jgi:hypothetical protein
MAKIPGYKIVLQFDTKTIVGYRDASMDYTADLAEATTGASTNQHKEYVSMFKGMTFSVSGLYDPTAGANSTADDVITLLKAGTTFTAKYGNIETGSKYYSASALINHVNISGTMSDLASYTIDVTVSGDVTVGTVV